MPVLIGGGGKAGDLFEGADKVGTVIKAAFQSDFGNGAFGGLQKAFGSADPTFRQVATGGFPANAFEVAHKGRIRHMLVFGKFFKVNFGFAVFVDILHAFDHGKLIFVPRAPLPCPAVLHSHFAQIADEHQNGGVS